MNMPKPSYRPIMDRPQPDPIDIQLAEAQTEIAKQARIANLIELAKLEVPFGRHNEGKLGLDDNAKVWLIAQASELLGLPENPPEPINLGNAKETHR